MKSKQKFEVKFTTFTSLTQIYRDDIKRKSLSIKAFSNKFKNAKVGDKETTTNFVMAKMGDIENPPFMTLRHAENVITYTAIVLDIDNDKRIDTGKKKRNGRPITKKVKLDNINYRSFDYAKKQLTKELGDYHFIIYTSFKSKPDYEKYRIIILLSNTIPKENLKTAVDYFNKKLAFGVALDNASANQSQGFIFPVKKKSNSKYRVFINDKSKLFNSKKLPKPSVHSIVQKVSKKQRKALSEKDFNFKKVDLNKLPLSDKVKQAIQTGDETFLKKEGYESRSEFCYAIIYKLAELKLEGQVIANIVLDADNGISERFIERGIQQTFVEVNKGISEVKLMNQHVFDDISPHYPVTDEMSANAASKEIHRCIQKWAQQPKGHLGIKASAGIGKTEAYLDVVVDSNAKLIEIYVPTHELGDECEQRLIKKGVHPSNIQVIKGRTYCSEGTKPLCQKYKAAEKLGAYGVSTYKSICRNDDGVTAFQCEYFDDCAYLAQFKTATQIRIFAHAYLPLKRGLLDKEYPDFAIIDESFRNTMVENNDENKTSLSFENINNYIKPASLANSIIVALEKNRPLLKYLRDKHDGDLDKLFKKAIKIIVRDYPAIKPDESENDVTTLLTSGYMKSRAIKQLLQQLQSELKQFPERSDSVTVRFVNNHIVIAHRHQMTRFTNPDSRSDTIPVLCVDADFSKNIAKVFLPGIKTKIIKVQRNSDVTQCITTTSAMMHFTPRQNALENTKEVDASKKRIADTQKVINLLHKRYTEKNQTLLVITYKSLLEGKSPKLQIPPGCQSLHFGKLRGIDKFKSCNAVVIIGRNEPSVEAVETIATCLWWDSKKPLNLAGEFDREVHGYRCINYAKIGSKVSVHQDKRVQLILEQIRECESLQAIDRIRLMHNSVKKEVYLMSNLPLDIDVNRLAKSKDLVNEGNQIGQLLLQSIDTVLPLSPTYLAKHHPEWFPPRKNKKEENISDEIKFRRVKDRIQQYVKGIIESGETLYQLEGHYFYINIHNRRFQLWSYRLAGARGNDLKALAPSDMHKHAVERRLEMLHEKEVIIKHQYYINRGFGGLRPRVHTYSEDNIDYNAMEYDPEYGWYVSLDDAE